MVEHELPQNLKDFYANLSPEALAEWKETYGRNVQDGCTFSPRIHALFQQTSEIRLGLLAMATDPQIAVSAKDLAMTTATLAGLLQSTLEMLRISNILPHADLTQYFQQTGSKDSPSIRQD